MTEADSRATGLHDPLDRLFWPVFAVLLATAGALPLAYRYLPLHDWPEHCAQATLAAHLDDPAWRLGEYYRSTGWFLPYQGMRQLQVGLGRLLGDSLGFRAALLPYLLGMPLAAFALVRRLGRDRWVALGTFCILVEGNLLWGFAPYASGVALLLWGTVLAIDFLQRGGRLRATGLTLIGAAVFFVHPHVTAFWGAAAGVLGVVAWRTRGEGIARPAVLAATALPGQALLAIYMLRSGWVSGTAVGGASAGDAGAVWYPPWTMAWTLPWSTGLRVAGDGPAWAYLGALAAVALGALAIGRSRVSPASSGWPAAGWALWGLFVLVLFAAPAHWRSLAISGRTASTVALATLWILPMRRPGDLLEVRGLAPARLGLVVAAASSLALMHHAFARFDEALRPLDRIAAQVPLGSRVATVVYDPFPAGLALPCNLHLGGYLHAARGGLASFSLTRLGFTYRDTVPRDALLVDRPWDPARRGSVLPAAVASYYDYIVVRTGPLYPGLPWPRDAAVTGRLLLDDAGFQLWRVDHP
ncbi:MAG: hypothetical protein EXR72_15110 [Myxococcales bacterium]|nr:hypothetical protein [Myxococcales bacterium]